jgi:hypothetical protein
MVRLGSMSPVLAKNQRRIAIMVENQEKSKIFWCHNQVKAFHSIWEDDLTKIANSFFVAGFSEPVLPWYYRMMV